jgi:hypothetical protein
MKKVKQAHNQYREMKKKYHLPVWKTHSPEIDFVSAPKEIPW